MFSSKQYRAKAAEYAERGRNTQVPNEILEYKNLRRRFTEMADNEEWVERNFKKTLHAPSDDQDAGDDAEEERILRCLGASVILHWNNLPKKLQKELFDSAGAMGDLLKTKALRAELARFLHEHKDARRSET
jgi:hypothetical protein